MPNRVNLHFAQGAGVIVTAAFAIYVQSRPTWTTDHPSLTHWLYYAAIVSAIFLFVSFILQWRWARTLFGIDSMRSSEQSPLPATVEAPDKSSRLKIISANWGVEGVLGGDPDKVDCLLERQSGNLFAELVGLDLFHGCIPAKGKLRLKVKGSFDGRKFTVVRQDGEFLMLPEDPYLKEKLDIFYPLQIEAFTLAKELRDFYTSLGPFPQDPAKNPGEDNEKYLIRLYAYRDDKQGKWEQKLSYGFANRQFGQRITALMHRAGEEYELKYPALLSSCAEIGPPFSSDGIPKLAQEMEMIAIWINRKQRNEVNLLG